MTANSWRHLGIQHVALPFSGGSAGSSEARAFYSGILGLPEAPVPANLTDFVLWFQVGGQELHLFAAPDEVAANVESHRHPCLSVDHLEAVRAALEAAGIEVIQPDVDIPGRRRLFVRDPFGNALELLETP